MANYGVFLYFSNASDLSENAALTLTFNSVNCKHLCHKCLIGSSELNDITLNSSQLILRTPENMRDTSGNFFRDYISMFITASVNITFYCIIYINN